MSVGEGGEGRELLSGERTLQRRERSNNRTAEVGKGGVAIRRIREAAPELSPRKKTLQGGGQQHPLARK